MPTYSRIAALAVLLAASLAHAQAPNQLAYQGRLLRSDGSPEVGVVSMTFALCSAATAGTCAAGQTMNVALGDGFYSVQLAATPSDLAGTPFLSIKVGTAELVPRQPLISVPYALVATTATTALPLAGGTMTGAINMGTNKVSNLPAPTVASDAATKGYVDAAAVGPSIWNCTIRTVSGTGYVACGAGEKVIAGGCYGGSAGAGFPGYQTTWSTGFLQGWACCPINISNVYNCGAGVTAFANCCG